ncbi:N-acetylgalactosamine-6-sulfatase [Haloferula helveola]|uniref:N-acetylgalactosamine-6-sulfatase n=1 Tax=Haloferula helveola TaxID=490095 RepID=A0ABN6H0F0_9BACT|nr:N-acetylgalactosamine-6-sulfatase [Haloferula helveola]
MRPLNTLCALLAGISCHVAPSVAEDRPNVILIVTDDQGYGDLACHGNPSLRTPNLDRLRSESVSLTNFHVDPYCTPTRAALMTGRYCTKVGAWTVTRGRQLLDPGERIMPEYFASAGYRTGMFGKWHLGDPYPYAPRFRGFEETVRHKAGGVDELGNPPENSFIDDSYFRNGRAEKFKGYCTDVFFREALRFIGTDDSRPFFVYLATNAMHSPFGVPERYRRRFDEQGHPENRAKFYGMIENFDDNLGLLMRELKERKLEDNTILIFMSDNGTSAGSDGKPGSADGFNSGMRGKKGSVYDGGHRVPCFVRWPAEIAGGREFSGLTTHRDWLPTLIEACNLNAGPVRFDGRSMAAPLRGESSTWPDRMLVVEHQDGMLESALPNGSVSHPFAVLSERWRLVNGKLYDATKDPGQTNDVAKAHPAVVNAHLQAYRDYWEEIGSAKERYSRLQLGHPTENPTEFTARDWFPTEGKVFWATSQTSDDALFPNGYWPVHVREAGTYRFELRRYPEGVTQPIGASRARISIGEKSATADTRPEAETVAFELLLPQGPAMLRTWLTDAASGRERGAYFIKVLRQTGSGPQPERSD